jgi:hypothetical protein
MPFEQASLRHLHIAGMGWIARTPCERRTDVVMAIEPVQLRVLSAAFMLVTSADCYAHARRR